MLAPGLIIVDVDLDHLAEVRFVIFLQGYSSPPPLLSILHSWEESFFMQPTFKSVQYLHRMQYRIQTFLYNYYSTKSYVV
jgi:hypothetical protein